MCGRFALTATPDELLAAFPWLNSNQAVQAVAPRYNIAPGQPIAVIANNGDNLLDFYTWGLLPFWAKDTSLSYKLINARAETLAEKPSFKAAYKYRRCLIPASGFYEWQAKPDRKSKTPHFIRLKSGQPFALAGLWERWQAPDGSEILSAAIITTEPNELVRPIHKRMPVILAGETARRWITPGEASPAALAPLLGPYPADEMEAYPVSTFVNSPANEGARCSQAVNTS